MHASFKHSRYCHHLRQRTPEGLFEFMALEKHAMKITHLLSSQVGFARYKCLQLCSSERNGICDLISMNV
ncbi:hypothetical protein K1719_012607 [Acacia pycnantha]|nr:hypothetical protein K1719_012607 [Acacia pycnantha]